MANWENEYQSRLQEAGLSIIQGRLSPFPDCRYFFDQSDKLLSQWKAEKKPISINVVVVSPNNGQLPLRTISYLAGAINTISQLQQNGFDVKRLTIINPCHINAFCDFASTNLEYQLVYGQQIQSYASQLAEINNVKIDVVLNQGNEIDAQHKDEAIVLSERLRTSPEVFDLLNERMTAHGGVSHDSWLYYLASHPSAWGYTNNGFFQPAPEEFGIINYMPLSEQAFLWAMAMAGIKLSPEQTRVVTVLSDKFISAPYYFKGPETSNGAFDINNPPTETQILKQCDWFNTNKGNVQLREVVPAYQYLALMIRQRKMVFENDL